MVWRKPDTSERTAETQQREFTLLGTQNWICQEMNITKRLGMKRFFPPKYRKISQSAGMHLAQLFLAVEDFRENNRSDFEGKNYKRQQISMEKVHSVFGKTILTATI